MSWERIAVGGMVVEEATTYSGTPCLRMEIVNESADLDCREVLKLRDEFTAWLRERGRDE